MTSRDKNVSELDGFIDRYLQRYPHISHYVVAYSGGIDSHVLLHLMYRAKKRADVFNLRAVHVHHGLQPSAEQWANHCAQICDDLSVPFRLMRAKIIQQSGDSLEAQAREKRYLCLAEGIDETTSVLTAHHQDDQAETVLLQLMRGSGPAGLAAMPEIKTFHLGYLGRPLLQATGDQLTHYANHYNLTWIDDPSNDELHFDRNYMRHNVLPMLRQRWPSAAKTISRSAAHCAELTAVLTDYLQSTIVSSQADRAGSLSVSLLLRLAPEQCKQVVRQWIKQKNLPLPNTKHLKRVMEDVLLADQSASPLVSWEGCEIRRYQDALFATSPLPDHTNVSMEVMPEDAIKVVGLGIYRFEQKIGAGFVWPGDGNIPLTVKYRHGGERCVPAGRGHQHQVKKLMQELAIPPWQRNRIPLLYHGAAMVAIGEEMLCEGYLAKAGEIGYRLVLERDEMFA